MLAEIPSAVRSHNSDKMARNVQPAQPSVFVYHVSKVRLQLESLKCATYTMMNKAEKPLSIQRKVMHKCVFTVFIVVVSLK